MAHFVKSKRKPPPLIVKEEESAIDSNGQWDEASFVVGRQGIQDKRKVGSSSEDDTIAQPTKYSLDSLEKMELIGFGSSGRVFHVQHRETKSDFALKCIPMDCSKQVRLQLLQEIRANSRLAHQNIVACPDAFLIEGTLYILLEYFDCGSLADLIKVSGPLPEKIIASFARQILSGLSFCHNQHYLHRDIKPSNFLVNSKGEAKIADFGTSSRLDGGANAASTWVGTVTYMSPERIKGSEYSFPGDIWSFGLTVFELAVAHYPYPPSENGQMGFWELLDLIVQKPAPSLSTDSFSKEISDFVAKCLEKEEKDRPSASDLLNHPFLAESNCATTADIQKWIKPYVKLIQQNLVKAAHDAELDMGN
ncbi:putative Mitogen-activated protein kinase kinase 1 [Blattamonas nauphoetae]|uniref:mitogen-activated protein kinase kinase n=1 Tax=Blattamonas nauphoetae TaxID=2049346 RepID=A0ABQ9Y9L6_9EUKA|nr:putative Mitogen-activated protein kinase kinase 1 [Blattamonas nauphoetae]